MLKCYSYTLTAIKHLYYWNSCIQNNNSNFVTVPLKCITPKHFFSHWSNCSMMHAFQRVLLLPFGKTYCIGGYGLHHKNVIFAPIRDCNILYWDFSGIFKVWLTEEILFLYQYEFSGCYILSKIQRNDTVLSEVLQFPGKPSPWFSPDVWWNAPLLFYFKWRE